MAEPTRHAHSPAGRQALPDPDERFDGIVHPTAAGHAVIAPALGETLREVLRTLDASGSALPTRAEGDAPEGEAPPPE